MSHDPTTDHGLLAEGAATDRPLTVIISDTHLAGGPDDVREDHVWRGTPLARFIDQLAASDEGKAGGVELIINGDFLEFVQAAPELYNSPNPKFWCSEDESVAKLKVILDGHPEVFTAMATFQEAGNVVTVMAGNHDIDLYWPRVREHLIKVAGPVRFELGREWYGRYGERLQIAHGHQLDPANRFEMWEDDPVAVVEGEPRLESCSGTRFVVGFINRIDARFPFVDNIKPELRMARVLWEEQRLGLGWAAWVLMGFLRRDGGAILGMDAAAEGSHEHVLRAIEQNDEFAQALLPIYRQVVADAESDVQDSAESDPEAPSCVSSEGPADIDLAEMRRRLSSSRALEEFLEAALDAGRLPDMPPLPSTALLGSPGSQPSGDGDGSGQGATLGLLKERMTDVVNDLRVAAKERSRQGAQVIVCGHTHVPDENRRSNYVYFNTGSWTRYLNIGQEDTVTLDQLKDGARFPFQLWSVQVREGADGKLQAEKVLFEEG